MNEFVARNGLIALDSSSISGPLTVSGRLGIGTTSPTALLDVRGNISSSGNFTIGGNIYKSVDTSNLGLYGGPTNSVLNGFIKINGQSNLWGQVQINIGYEPDNSKGIWTLNDSTQLMTLTGRGRLGIGTTSPSGNLHVVGTSVLSGSVLIGSSNGVNTGTFIDGNGTITVIRSINGATYGLRVHNGAGWAGHNGIEAIAYQYPIYGAQGSNGSVIASPLSSGAAVFGRGGVGVQGLGATPAGDSGSIGVMASTLFVNNASNTALYDRNVSVHIVGTSQTVLKVDSGTVSNILFISSSGNVGIGTSSPTAALDVNGTMTSQTFITTNANIDKISVSIPSGGDYRIRGFSYTGTLTISAAYLDNGGQIILYGNTHSTNAGNIYMRNRVGINTPSPTYGLDVNGSFRSSGAITATSGSDYFDISHDITQPAQTGSQVYEVNITPTLRYTAPNQTQTALRVAATFSGSTALSSSQSNIIADFGSTSAGSQLVVNDITSGSIYMVNDVSGIPIIEANSNWDVFIYDYPNVVLKKTGSAIEISGSLTIASGSNNDLYMYGHKMFSVGAFQSDQTQSGSANVSQSITYTTTDYSNGVTYVSGSRLTVANAGVYNIQFSAQIDRISGSGTDTVYIWLKKNGTNVTNSAGAITIAGTASAAKIISSWNYVVDAAASDYFELCWQTTDSNIQLINVAAAGNIPGIPSVIVTVTQVR